jgi:hypothetical protein
MTDLDLLKSFREDTPAPDPTTLAKARQRLLTPPPRSLYQVWRGAVRAPDPHVSAPTKVPAPAGWARFTGRSSGVVSRRRVVAGRRRVVVAGALAMVLAGGFLVADVVTRDGATPAGTVANASTFLAAAAAASSADPDDPIPPGQYLQISTRTERLRPLGDNPSLRATIYGSRDTWIASDHKPPYPSTSSRQTRVDFASPQARELARKIAPYLFVVRKPLRELESCPTVSTGFSFTEGGTCRPSWENPSYDFLAAQPRDPDALLAAIRRDTRVPAAADSMAWLRIGLVLSTGIVPSDLRAALYQAARKLPGIELLDDVVTVDGRRARVISRDSNDGIRHDLLIAEDGGEFLGSRAVATKDGPPDINGKPELSLRRGDILSSKVVTTRFTSTPPPAK